jgi:hypothetical protein
MYAAGLKVGIIRGSYALIDVSPSLIVLESYCAVSAMGCFSTLRIIIKVRATVRSSFTIDVLLRTWTDS